jgi:hypothetical protein
MSSDRKTALIAGALFVITFITSIPAALLLYSPVLDHTNYILGAGADTRVALGALLEILLIIANVGSAVVLFPILVAIHDWTFLLGPGWIVGVGNGLILGYLMYRPGLVPRGMAMLGLIGGPLIIVAPALAASDG